MTTTKQAAANRVNCLASTGPSSPAGKAVASRNALRHGLASSRVLALDKAEAEVLEQFIEDVRKAFDPVGAYEELLVDRLTSILWRLRRVVQIETELIKVETQGNQIPNIKFGLAFANSVSGGDAFGRLAKYETGLERAFQRMIHELQRAQAARAGHPVVPPLIVDVNVETT